VREAIVSEMRPQPLDRIEFGRIGRQEHQAEVFGNIGVVVPTERGMIPPDAGILFSQRHPIWDSRRLWSLWI
jgi:hypothetical protein